MVPDFIYDNPPLKGPARGVTLSIDQVSDQLPPFYLSELTPSDITGSKMGYWIIRVHS